VEQRGVHDLGRQASRLARLAVVYADRVRMKIVTEAYMREMSPTVFFDEFGGGSLPRVSQHFEKLAMADWLWLERTETGGQRRGGESSTSIGPRSWSSSRTRHGPPCLRL